MANNASYDYDQIMDDTTGKLSYKLETPIVYSKGVKTMQQYLYNIGYNVTIDGYFGQKTYDAVVGFQTECSLFVDGAAGKNTLTELDKARKSTYFTQYGKPITSAQWGRAYILTGVINDVDLLSRSIWVEEHGILNAQPAVAKVIKNRSAKVGDTSFVASVPKEDEEKVSIWARIIACPQQYACAEDSQAYSPIRGDINASDGVAAFWKNAVDLAKKLVNRTAFTVPAAYYVNPSTQKVDTSKTKMKAITDQLYQVGRTSFIYYMKTYVCTDCYTYATSIDSGYKNGFLNTSFIKK